MFMISLRGLLDGLSVNHRYVWVCESECVLYRPWLGRKRTADRAEGGICGSGADSAREENRFESRQAFQQCLWWRRRQRTTSASSTKASTATAERQACVHGARAESHKRESKTDRDSERRSVVRAPTESSEAGARCHRSGARASGERKSSRPAESPQPGPWAR